ncbi:hypothetical protein RB601_003164 [Gaeumannomyces tritici]
MATDRDEPAQAPVAAALSSDSDSSDGEGGSPASGNNSQVEWLVTGRSRRSTAGNRMKSMIAQEAAAAGLRRGADEDSDLELLFAEADDDEGFTDDGERDDASDAHMDSSSEGEDDAAGGADDELEGEKELERVAREKRVAARKRKAQEAIPAKFRKRVRIDSTPSTTPARGSETPTGRAPRRQRQEHQPRPKKKSERTSWLPTAADMPTRASERSTTRMSKEQLHQQMVEREVRRKKQLEIQEKKAKRLEALKKPPMTQADRLREAALVEKRNSKSLNRWEEAEKQREEERERKLAALYSRTLEGPVFTFWSGIMELSEGQMKHVGRMVAMEEKAPRKKRQSAAAAAAATAIPTGPEASAPDGPGEPLGTQAQKETLAPAENLDPGAGLAAPAFHEAVFRPIGLPASPADDAPQTAEPKPVSSGVLAPPVSVGVLAPPLGASPGPMQMPGFNTAPLGNGSSTVLALPNTSHGSSLISIPPIDPPPETPVSVPPTAIGPATDTVEKVPPAPAPPLHQPAKTAAPKRAKQGSAAKAPAPASQQPAQEAGPEPPLEGKVTRNCIILQSFDQKAIEDKTVQTQILFGRKMNKLAKPGHAPHCVITGHVARYKDPKTGLPFANMNACKQIRRLTQGEYKWSSLLGLWVGTGEVAAKGVPSRFLHGGPKEESPPPEPTPPATISGGGAVAAAAVAAPLHPPTIGTAAAGAALPSTPNAPAKTPPVAAGPATASRPLAAPIPATMAAPHTAAMRPVAHPGPPPAATHPPFTSSSLAAPVGSSLGPARPGITTAQAVLTPAANSASQPPPPPPPRPPFLAPVMTYGVTQTSTTPPATNSTFTPVPAVTPTAAPAPMGLAPALAPPSLKSPASHDAHASLAPSSATTPALGPPAAAVSAATPAPTAPPVPTTAPMMLVPKEEPGQDAQGAAQPTSD